ncbi:MAG: hypothetical protein COA33_010430 [Fluviicola sp.]|nr:hypothetical protein [Fluviicola sp.]
MNIEFVRSFLLTNGKYFPESKLNEISSDMELSSEKEFVVNLSYRNPLLITVLYWFLPIFWAFDRFFVRDYFGGLVKALYPSLLILSGVIVVKAPKEIEEWGLPIIFVMAGVYFLWVLVDGITIYGRVKMSNYRKVKNSIGCGNFKRRLRLIPVVLLVILIATVSAVIYESKFDSSYKSDVENMVNDTNESSDKNEGGEFVEEEFDYSEYCGTPDFENNADLELTDYEMPSDVFNNPNVEPTDNELNESSVFDNNRDGGTGINATPIIIKREIFAKPIFSDLNVIEKCKVEYKLLVDPEGNVRNVVFMGYRTFSSKDSLSKKEKRKRKSAKNILLNDLKNKILIGLKYEIGSRTYERYSVALEKTY